MIVIIPLVYKISAVILTSLLSRNLLLAKGARAPFGKRRYYVASNRLCLSCFIVTWHRMIHERLIAFEGVSLSVLFSDSLAVQRGDEPIVGRSHTLVGQ